jgi:cob(I)alamin adenosyltransferase
MGNRLTKIYTRTGDDGSTGLGTDQRVPKDSPRVEAYGAVDELNSTIGVVLAQDVPDQVQDCLSTIQHDLLDLGGELCLPDSAIIKAEAVERLETTLDCFNEELPPLKDFIVPGGGPAAAACHAARTVCRRAERRTWTLAGQEALNPHALEYLNRLSDLLFVLARVLSRHEKSAETLWKDGRLKQKKR